MRCEICEKHVDALWYAQATETILGTYRKFEAGEPVCVCEDCAAHHERELKDEENGTGSPKGGQANNGN